MLLHLAGAARLTLPLRPTGPSRACNLRREEERRREGREASAVRQREAFPEHPMSGNIPHMLTDGQVLAHVRNAAPMHTEFGRQGALAAQLLLLDSSD